MFVGDATAAAVAAVLTGGKNRRTGLTEGKQSPSPPRKKSPLGRQKCAVAPERRPLYGVPERAALPAPPMGDKVQAVPPETQQKAPQYLPWRYMIPRDFVLSIVLAFGEAAAERV